MGYLPFRRCAPPLSSIFQYFLSNRGWARIGGRNLFRSFFRRYYYSGLHVVFLLRLVGWLGGWLPRQSVLFLCRVTHNTPFLCLSTGQLHFEPSREVIRQRGGGRERSYLRLRVHANRNLFGGGECTGEEAVQHSK